MPDGEQFERALGLFHDMQRYGMSSNVFTSVAPISACEKSKQFELASELLHAVQQYGGSPDVFTSSAPISAFEKGNQLERASSYSTPRKYTMWFLT